MASSRSRKFKLEPITEEELRDTAGMSGFVSFFTNPLLQPNDAEPKQATSGTVPLVATVPTLGTVPKVGSIHPESTPREIRSFSTQGTAPKVETVPSLGTVPGFRARTVQDGHTVWEQQIYEALWREATPSGGPESREIAIGYRHIAKLTRLGLNTVQRNMRTLVDKLALEPVGKYDSDTRTPKTYRVYSYRAILERRAAAGLEWVIKNRQGVTLGTVPKVGPVPTVATAPKVSRAPVPTVGTGNSPHGGDTFREEEKISREEPSSSELMEFQAKAGPLIGIDDDAARAIIRGCRKHDHQATIDEIWHFCEQKILERAQRRESVGPGLLITAIPKYFTPPASELHRYRAERGLRFANQ